MRERIEDLSLLSGSNVEESLQGAMQVWNAFWGPLGVRHIDKGTLVNNSNLVFKLVEATVPGLISSKIQLEDEIAELEFELEQARLSMLTILKLFSEHHRATCTELSYVDEEDVEDHDGEQTNEIADNQRLVKGVPQLPKWKLKIYLGDKKALETVITHDEYVSHFSHIKCNTL